MSSNVLDFCRLCFREDGNISVFEYECSDDSWSLADRIFECVSVQISQDDKLPHTVCESCLQTIIRWCDFKTLSDRNQRTWFLWLKSISFGSPEEIQERLRLNARKKCVELGYKTKPCKSLENCSFQPYEKPQLNVDKSQPASQEDAIVIQEDAESHSNNVKGLRIESTRSLVDFYDRGENETEFPSEKLTNGFLVVDSDNSSPCPDREEECEKSENESNLIETPVNNDPPNITSKPDSQDPNQNSGDSNISEKSKRHDRSAIIPPEEINLLDNILDDRENTEGHNQEIEDAFPDEESNNETITEREQAILNGEELPANILNKEVDLERLRDINSCLKDVNNVTPVMSLIHSGKSCGDILRARLIDKINNDMARTTSPPQQPKRPDTPYPHEQLKNMAAKVSENSSVTSLSCPSRGEYQISSPGVKSFTTPGPVSLSTDGSMKPISLIHLLNKPVPEPPPQSDQVSESSTSASDSTFYNRISLGARIKQEPLSDDGETEDDPENYYNNISIKMEPVEYSPDPVETDTGPDEMAIEPNCTSCRLCKKRFSSHNQVVRHVQTSKLHKRISSFAALGHTIDNKVIAQLSHEMRSQALLRSHARKKMIAMDGGMPEVKVSDLNLPSPVSRLGDNNLLECKICNIVLPSRSLKVKHDNSRNHLLNLDAQMNGGESSVQPTKEVTPSPAPPSVPTTMYTCPFASCSSVFTDGGQLIVHMHAHGISLPIHETNKQIQLSQQLTQIILPQNDFSLEQGQFCHQDTKTEEKKKNPSRRVILTEVPPGTGKYTCRRCNRSFLKKLSLTNHLRSCRFPVPRPVAPCLEKCPVCQIPQRNRKCLTYHVKMYHPEVAKTSLPLPPVNTASESRDFKCQLCSMAFRTKINLNSHIQKVHNKVPATCKICNKNFSSRSSLSSHYKLHFNMKEGEYVCLVCFKISTSRRESYLHRKAGCSLKIKLFSCSSCIFTFRSQEALDKHKEDEHGFIRVPKVEVPLDTSCLDDPTNTSCNLCEKRYSSYGNLKRHFNTTHVNAPDAGTEELIKIESSDPSTSQSAGLDEFTEHSIGIPETAEVNKGVQCLYCTNTFTTRKSMFHHMRTVCRSIPSKIKCRGCKAERWPWLTGRCRECGRAATVVTPRSRSTSISEPPNKKPRISEVQQSTVQPPSSTPISKSEQSVSSTKKVKRAREYLYKCPIGKRYFLSQRTMISHSASCDGACKDQSVYCKVCHQLYSTPRVYLRHKPCSGKPPQTNLNVKASIPTPQTEEPQFFACIICPQRFKSTMSLGRHLRSFHNYYSKRRYKRRTKVDETSNDITDSTSNNVTDLSLNNTEVLDSGTNESLAVSSNNPNDAVVGSTDNDETYCRACGRTFSDLAAFSLHFKNYHKNKYTTIDCTFCSKGIFKRELYEHGFCCIREQLANIDTLECVQCSTIFYSTDEEDTLSLKLQEHIMMCCGKLSTRKGEKFKNKEKFLCLKCCMLFSSKKSLYAHSFERHNILIQTSPTSQPKTNPSRSIIGTPGISNSIVENSEDKNRLLETHDSNFSPTNVSVPAIYKCGRCSKTFKTSKGLKCHKANGHNYTSNKRRRSKVLLKCKYCQRQFYNEMKLLNHEKVHGIVQEIVLTEEDNNTTAISEDDSSPVPTTDLVDNPDLMVSQGDVES